jgi:hypothetical protein
LIIGLVVLAIAAGVSLWFRYADVPASQDAAAIVTSSAFPSVSASTVQFTDAGPMPSVIMTLGEDSDADIDPIADRADDVARCLERDRTCLVITHSRGVITAVMPEEDDEKAAQCVVQALEGAILDESTPQNVRICITHTR